MHEFRWMTRMKIDLIYVLITDQSLHILTCGIWCEHVAINEPELQLIRRISIFI